MLIGGFVILMNVITIALFHCKSPKCISNCCADLHKFFKCKTCKRCNSCMQGDWIDNTNKTDSQITDQIEMQPAKIEHRDVSITFQEGLQNSIIYRNGMEIRLGSEAGIPGQNPDFHWSDVSRNIDIVMCLVMFVVYAVVYTVFLLIIFVNQND